MRPKRWKSRPNKANMRRKGVVIAIVITLISGVYSFTFIERHLREPLINIATVRVKQIATQAINEAIANKVAQETSFEQLVSWRTDDTGRISGAVFNSNEHARITSETIRIVQDALFELERVPETIPIGQALNSAIIASFGPKIGIRMVPAGAVQVDLATRAEDAGINMVLVEIFVRVRAEVTVIIPFQTRVEVVQTEIPISYSLVVGDVPQYYFDHKGNSSSGEFGSSVPVPPISLPAP